MKRRLVALVGILLAASLVGEGLSASAQEGAPMPAKDWEGSVQVSSASPSFAVNYFTHNACDWAGHEGEVNGSDAWIWDVKGYDGLPLKVSWSYGEDVGGVSFYFVSAECGNMPGTGVLAEEVDKEYETLVPLGAGWLIVDPVTPGYSVDLGVKVHTDGTPPPPEKKPKKKKKKRH